jgi:hypothetical protein
LLRRRGNRFSFKYLELLTFLDEEKRLVLQAIDFTKFWSESHSGGRRFDPVQLHDFVQVFGLWHFGQCGWVRFFGGLGTIGND